MNLFELMAQLPPTGLDDLAIPDYLLGSFRRKSISFCTGQTDEHTIVYWFQSKSFSIDLRLCHATQTPLCERQGWIGNTLWDEQTALLSWQIDESYQPRTQWPEPAQLLHIGNCILEFAPSKAYVEDWRQQATQGAFLGLRLQHIQHLTTGQTTIMQGGWVLCGEHIAFALGRLPNVAAKFAHSHDVTKSLVQGLSTQQFTTQDIESYEVSVSLANGIIHYSTQSNRLGQSLHLTGFEMAGNGQIVQHSVIAGQHYRLYFTLDVFMPDYCFANHSSCTPQTEIWMQQEKQHLFKHTEVVR